MSGSSVIGKDFAHSVAEIKSQLTILSALMLLSFDELNPVKLVGGALGVPLYVFGWTATFFLLYTFVAHLRTIFYYGTKMFFIAVLSIFFSEIEVIGRDNIPRHGPVVFTGNHANQFVDALNVLCNCEHKIGFLIAQKSWDTLVVGILARLLGCIPIARPQDKAKKGAGKIEVAAGSTTVRASEGADFKAMNLRAKDKLRICPAAGSVVLLTVKAVVSSGELECSEAADLPAACGPEATAFGYEVLGYVDQSTVFAKVHEALSHGVCLGIFPEGGSHDRTDLLPLKVGVAVMAFGTQEKYGISVPVVPVGLNYYRGHRFRGRVVVEYGPPIYISNDLMEKYKESKKDAYGEYLGMVEDGMRACLVTTPSYQALQIVHMARRLWVPSGYIPSSQQKQDLNRRFAQGYKLLHAKYDDGLPSEVTEDDVVEKQEMPPAMAHLRNRLLEYIKLLQEMGLRDYQVPTLELNMWKVSYTFLHLISVFALAAVPSLFLNAPVGLICRILAEKHRKKSLAGSKVKITGRDVMLSKKITLSIVLVPTLWVVYAVALYFLTGLAFSTIFVIFMSFPLFSFMGVKATEAGMVAMKDLRPAYLRLIDPSVRKKMDTLPNIRAELVQELKAFIKEMGPSFGSIYNDTEVKWDEYMSKSGSTGDLFQMGGNFSGSTADLSRMASTFSSK